MPRRRTSSTGEYRVLARGVQAHGAPWIAARARNALRRWVLILTAGGLTFVAALLALVLVPRSATRAARVAMPRESERPDTEPLAAAVARAAASVAAADAALASSRVEAARVVALATARAAAAVDTLSPELRAKRDSLAASSGALGRLIAHAESAPLPASYRALGQSRELRNDPRVRALLDSLTDIENQRDAFGAVGGVDPIFVALTSRASVIGRTIQAIAVEKRAAIRRELAPLRPPAAPAPVAAAVATASDSAAGDTTGGASAAPRVAVALPASADTAARGARADSARARFALARSALDDGRRRALEYQARVDRARELANVAAPPVALLAAALVLGAATGFVVSLLAEMRHPRVADAREVELLAGTRVIAIVQPRPPVPERARRRADLEAPPLIDYGSEAYRLLYLHVSATGSALPLVTVTGDDAPIVATVAANLAAASAYEARSTLLVDGDLNAGAVSGVVRVAPEPGLTGVIFEQVGWAEAVHTATVGRDRTLDVIPSGVWPPKRAVPGAAAERVRRDLTRIAYRYDFAVLVADEAHAERGGTSIVPGPDVIIVARVGFTPLAWLADAVDGLGHTGSRVRGIVLWDVDVPQVPTREEMVAAQRGRRVAA
ncbi:MAG TPA: hypothetical protein VNS52_16935 [Gemmatimonadaceae bacterium]|nr:hypothetical protein [Gemmatimonadaceae bacterium]